MARQIKTDETYLGRLLKLIPSEVVAAYLVIQGVIPKENQKWGSLIVSLVLFIITPFYLRKVENVRQVSQIIVSSLNFIVWVYSLGGPFAYFNIHQPWIASVLLIIWTTFMPRFFKIDENN